MRKAAMILLIILIVGLGITEVMLPRYYEKQVEKELYHEANEIEFVEAKITTHPALLLLSGRIQNGSIIARGIKVDNVRIDSLEALYEDLILIKTPEGIKACSGTNTHFKAEILEEDLNTYLKMIFPQFDQLMVEMLPGKAIINAKLNNWINVKLSGSLEVVDEYHIKFVPVQDADSHLTSTVISQVLSLLEFDVGLKDLPIPVDLKRIEIYENKILVLGGSRI